MPRLTRLASTEGIFSFLTFSCDKFCGLGGEQEQIDGDLLQLAGKADISRVTLTVGKMGVGTNSTTTHTRTIQPLSF